MDIGEILQNQHDFFLVSCFKAPAQKVNNAGRGSPDRFLKEMFSYIDLPFGEWVQNYGDFIFDARGWEIFDSFGCLTKVFL